MAGGGWCGPGSCARRQPAGARRRQCRWGTPAGPLRPTHSRVRGAISVHAAAQQAGFLGFGPTPGQSPCTCHTNWCKSCRHRSSNGWCQGLRSRRAQPPPQPAVKAPAWPPPAAWLPWCRRSVVCSPEAETEPISAAKVGWEPVRVHSCPARLAQDLALKTGQTPPGARPRQVEPAASPTSNPSIRAPYVPIRSVHGMKNVVQPAGSCFKPP